jgi:hypothetical protein
MIFKEGDKVKTLADVAGVDFRGKTGIVVHMNGDDIGIQFDDVIPSHELHDCDGHGFKGKCRYARPSDRIELLGNPVALKTPTHLVVWDEHSRDPCKFFTSEQEAKDFIKELSEKTNLIKDSVRLVCIKSVEKVKIDKILRYSQYKI